MSSRDLRFGCHRVRDALPVTDPGADLDGFVEQGERALRLLEREPGREVLEGDRERAVDAGGTGDAHRFFSGRDCGVERRFGDLEHAAEHDECVCEFEGVSGLLRELDPFLRVTSCPLKVVPKEREQRLSPRHRRKPYTERRLGSFRDADEVFGPLEIETHRGALRGLGGDHGKERVTVAARDRDRSRGPVHREFAGPAPHRQGRHQAQRVLRRGCLDRPVERSTEVVDVAGDDAGPLEVLSAP